MKIKMNKLGKREKENLKSLANQEKCMKFAKNYVMKPMRNTLLTFSKRNC